ncbi:methionyl-tRNA formyltransferase [Metamycoplasma subdolum]|uniref:methionyl-tRNA formyltransferase n=1 Tax=Metamycoplasma subdolum TaxID=92407 RepID=A0A3M0A1K5_9BACT|nr:methionyl-tRNA formyltransferase [Metamycoplasma subdolum]RMA79061.1 methionyl-tRNA formyltransferase [Metamycoplasma subdolum]WPB50584.1 methionyl-tRNA formyltransferase [Metamycoplasma subdolum]
MNSKKIRLILAGTGSFSAKIFESLINNKDFEIVALISQPNLALDRNKKPIETEVSKLAKKHKILLFQPLKIREIFDELSTLDFDYFITASYGQFIPTSIINLPKKAALNVHGSLLEKYRGAAPVQYTLLNGDTESGITLIYMIKEMDAGDMLAKAKILIEENDTAIEVFDKLADIAILNLPIWLNAHFLGKLEGEKQDESKVTFAPKIPNEMPQIFETNTTEEALRKIKAFNNQPGAFIIKNNKRLKIFRATKNKVKVPLTLDFSDGKLYLIEYQFEGKKIVKYDI